MINLKNLNLEIFAGGFITLTLTIIMIMIFQKVSSSTEILQILKPLGVYSNFFIFTAIIFSYIVGLTLNDVGFYLTEHLFVKRIKKKYFPGDSLVKYNQIKAKVFENSNIITERLDFYHNMIRLSRILIIGFSIALLYNLYSFNNTIATCFFVLFILIFLLKLNAISHRYYKEMYAIYKAHNE